MNIVTSYCTLLQLLLVLPFSDFHKFCQEGQNFDVFEEFGVDIESGTPMGSAGARTPNVGRPFLGPSKPVQSGIATPVTVAVMRFANWSPLFIVVMDVVPDALHIFAFTHAVAAVAATKQF